MALSLIPRKKRKREFAISMDFVSANRPAIFAFALLASVFALYGALVFYGGSLGGELEALEQKVQILQSGRDKDKENAVIEFDAKLTKLAGILANHVYSSNIFPFIGSITHPKVQFTSFSFSSDTGTVSMKALTEGYTTFGEQVVAFEQVGKIENLSVSGVQLKKSGQVEFNVLFDIEESIYK